MHKQCLDCLWLKILISLHNENSQRILTCIFVGIISRIYGITFNLTCSPQYTKWFELLWHNRSPIISNFDMDLVSSPRTSQSSQLSNSMPSPTTNVASNQSSQLAHPPCSRNPALMGDSTATSRHLIWILTPSPLPSSTRGHRRRQEPSPSPPLSPASSTPNQRPHTHTYASHPLSTLTIAPPSWPALLLSVCKNEFSIN